MHILDKHFLSEKPLQVAVVGVGGTGSELVTALTQLHQTLRVFGHGGLRVYAFDPDTVSPANIVRQRYHQADLGRNKAEVLITRVNLACNLNWVGIPEKFNGTKARQNWDLVISCVDTRKSRAELHAAAFSAGLYTWRYWLDCGNDKTTGQVVLGTPRHIRLKRNHLPCATELHPEIMDTTLPDDDRPSCSAIEALERQSLGVNRHVVTYAFCLLEQLLIRKALARHAVYFNSYGFDVAARAV